jgi:hypothetical protein
MARGIVVQMSEKGDFKKTFKFLKAMQEKKFLSNLDKYGERGVQLLSENTPRDTGLTASSWYYKIEDDGETLTLTWYNSNIKKDYFNVALMLQYGHATKNGGWIEGIDYINPALKPLFDEMEKDIWEEVKSQ